MGSKKHYSGNTEEYAAKLERVMARMGVEFYQYDWAQTRGGASCFVEMRYGGRTYRFDNSAVKSADSGRGLVWVSDLFAAIVLSLEGLARAVEQGIFSLDMLLAGVPALPEAVQLEPCMLAMGFDHRPESVEEVKEQYRRMAKIMHPDTESGSDEAMRALNDNYNAVLELVRED